MDNEGIYNVGKEKVKQNTTFCQTETFASPLWVGPSCEKVTKMTAWQDSSSSNHVLHTWPFRGLLLMSYLRANREIY